ncbi:MAG TPA: hypothetical protein VK530_14145 [Candidatus Acidoferrum sp.]|nr:hypothetical protein [Candidatus Acidoferrum sp.]
MVSVLARAVRKPSPLSVLLVRDPLPSPHDLILHQRDVRRGTAKRGEAEAEEE